MSGGTHEEVQRLVSVLYCGFAEAFNVGDFDHMRALEVVSQAVARCDLRDRGHHAEDQVSFLSDFMSECMNGRVIE